MTDRTVFENCLLGFLMEQPCHGYDLSLHFGEEGDLAGVGRLGRSHLYALLQSLQAAGCAVSAPSPGKGGPTRSVFAITEEGRERFLAWVRAPVPSIRDLRLQFVLKLYFLRRLVLPGGEELIHGQLALLATRAREIGEEKARRQGTRLWVLELQERLVEAASSWLLDRLRRSGG